MKIPFENMSDESQTLEEYVFNHFDMLLSASKTDNFSFETIDGWDLSKVLRSKTPPAAILTYYMRSKDIDHNIMVYPFAGLDMTNFGKIFRCFEKPLFIDSYNSAENSTILNRKIMSKYAGQGIRFIDYDLKIGLPKKMSTLDSHGKRINIEELMAEKSVDLLILNGRQLDDYDKLIKDIGFCLAKNSIVAIEYATMVDFVRQFGLNLDGSDPYVLPGVILRNSLILDLVPLDMRIPDIMSGKISEKMGKDVKYLNQLSDWYFFQKSQNTLEF